MGIRTPADAAAPIYASAFTVGSSKHIKENVSELSEEEALNLLKIKALSFDYKEKFGEKNQRGFYAEDVAPYFPTCVIVPDGYNEDEFDEEEALKNMNYLSIDYSKFVPFIIKLAQIQQRQIDALEKKIDNMTSQ